MKRQIYPKLKEWAQSEARKPLILRGARQVGKTWLLKAFAKEYFPKFHYLNFEDDPGLVELFNDKLNADYLIEQLQFYLDVTIDAQKDLLIFDEIQKCPRALTSLKYFAEQKPALPVCAAGSLLGLNLGEASFPVGKVTFLDLYPLNFHEFLLGIGKQRYADGLKGFADFRPLPDAAHQELWELWKTYLIVGGLPEAVNIYTRHSADAYRAFTKVRQTQRDLLNTYMADIAKHSGKTNSMDIERVWRSVPAQLAQDQKGSSSKFKFRGIVPGIRGYEQLSQPVHWLEKANLILRTSIIDTPLVPYMAYIKENRFKQYFFDTGLLGAMSNLDPAMLRKYDFGTYKGYLAENFVAQELKASGVETLLCWAGRTSEIEFLLPRGHVLVPLEVKAGNVTKSKSLKVFLEKYQPNLSVVISAKKIKQEGSRLHIPLYLAGFLREIVGE